MGVSMLIEFEEPQSGQESVWSYPRPPLLVAASRHITVRFADETVAETDAAIRYIETAHPPTYFIPRSDVNMDLLEDTGFRTSCEWRGEAAYYDVVVGDARAGIAAVAFPAPAPEYAVLADYIAFHAGRCQQCTIDGEVAIAQQGPYYFGWITSEVVGPFKGAPGTINW